LGWLWISLISTSGSTRFGGELDAATLRAGIDLLDAELFRLQFEQGQAHQVLGRLGQQAEAVDHLHLQFLEPSSSAAEAMRLYRISRACTSGR
jgi:hypothetical protein